MFRGRTVAGIDLGSPSTWAGIPLEPDGVGQIEDVVATLDTASLDAEGTSALVESITQVHQDLTQQPAAALGVWVARSEQPTVTGILVVTRIVEDEGIDVTPKWTRRILAGRDLDGWGITDTEVVEEPLRAGPSVRVTDLVAIDDGPNRLRRRYIVFPRRTKEALDLAFETIAAKELAEEFLLDAEAIAHSLRVQTAKAP